MDEIWKPIPGYSGHMASNLGRVKGIDRVVKCGYGATRTQRGKLIVQRLNGWGRPVVSLCQGNKQRQEFVHRLVLMAFVGPQPVGMEACHNDGCKTNNQIENLRWDTRSANVVDEVVAGRHHLTKLTVDQVRQIKASSEMHKVLAKRFGVTRSNITAIKSGKSWRHTS
jgi:hypothetical protein